MTDQEQVERFLTTELEQRMEGRESCARCGGFGELFDWDLGRIAPCRHCQGTGKSPAITAAKEALAAYRRERERVGRLLKYLEGKSRAALYEAYRRCAADALAEYNAPVKEPAQGGDSHE